MPPGAVPPAEKPAEKTTGEQPLEQEANPPAGIIDSQGYITYKSAAGKYSVQAPAGWVKTENGTTVKFTDNYNGEQVVLTKCDTAPTVESIMRNEAKELEKTGRAVKPTEMRSSKMPDGSTAMIVVYTSNSEPDPKTKKQIRLQNINYYYYKPGTMATLTLSVALGNDNRAQWTKIAESFKWE